MTVPYVSVSSSQCIVLQCLWTDWVIVHDGTIPVCQQLTVHCTTMFMDRLGDRARRYHTCLSAAHSALYYNVYGQTG